MKKLQIVTTITGTVFDTYVKPASEERKNEKTGEVYDAQPAKPYLQFIGEKILDKETLEGKKQIVDVKMLPNTKVSDFDNKDVSITVSVFQMGKDVYYNQTEGTEVVLAK